MFLTIILNLLVAVSLFAVFIWIFMKAAESDLFDVALTVAFICGVIWSGHLDFPVIPTLVFGVSICLSAGIGILIGFMKDMLSLD